MKASCHTCDKGMTGGDNKRRCRENGREISPDLMLAQHVERHGCADFAREPGSDDEQPWYAGGWCDGRGD